MVEFRAWRPSTPPYAAKLSVLETPFTTTIDSLSIAASVKRGS